MIRLRLIIEGRVQGVGFRSNTRRLANKLGLRGWVRNLRSGKVEIVVEGPEEMVDRLASWCHRGPTSAYVSKVTSEKETPTGEYTSFTSRRTL